MKIAIGSDHAGFQAKTKIIEHLQKVGHIIVNYGTNNEESCDYPDYVHQVAKVVVEDDSFDFGILCCGSGQGVNIVANKHKGIRSALCWSPEIAKLSREHNDANILAIPSRFVKEREIIKIVDAFLESKLEERHQRRIDMIEIKNF